MMLYELDEIEKAALLGETRPQSEFDKVFAALEDPDYPATCVNCGLEGTNASLDAHECPKAEKPRPGEKIQEFWCDECWEWHQASVLGGPVDSHLEAAVGRGMRRWEQEEIAGRCGCGVKDGRPEAHAADCGYRRYMEENPLA